MKASIERIMLNPINETDIKLQASGVSDKVDNLYSGAHDWLLACIYPN